MKFELDDFHRGVSDDDLIMDIKRVATQLGQTTLSIPDYQKCGKYGKKQLTQEDLAHGLTL